MPRTTVIGGLSAPKEIGRSRLVPRGRGRRRGFTLVELLAVIATIGILVALLLPAVTSQRETARKTQCGSRLRQVGIGLHAYQDARSTLPSGLVADRESIFDSKSWGWGALLLPYVEEHALAGRLDVTRRPFDAVAADPERARHLRTSVRVYQCPSDSVEELSHRLRPLFVPLSVRDLLAWSAVPTNPFAGSGPMLAHAFFPPGSSGEGWEETYSVGVQIAKSNYVASIGSQWSPQWDDWSDADFKGNGLFGRNSEVRHSEITDGAGKTLAVGERSYRNYAAVWPGSNSWQRCGFVDNQMVLGTAAYPINDAPVALNIDCDGQGSANFSSNHRGGANFLFADGAVRFLAEDVDTAAFHQMARRDDGENVGDF